MGQPDRIIGTRVFGGYAITRKIGEGGMGAVYVAENLELRKKLAVKVLLPDRLASKSAASRFLAEARAASAINHRNIIDILDSSTLPDGRHYILMEHLEGTTLRRYSRGIGPMPVDVVLAIMAQVCSGLQAAHDRGIVHRDLKPSNIFLAPQPDNPYFAKVLDFGIAKLDDPNLAGDIATKSHTVAGTPNYMAPEQARALRDVDHRADVYSIGAIIYELLTGKVPYKAGSIGDLTYKQASTTPATVSQLRPDVSPAWNALVMNAIALEPDQRTSSVADVAFQMMSATEHGEAIARATASMLFAPPSSSSIAPRERAERPAPFEDVRSITASLGEGQPSPMMMAPELNDDGLDTRAATPMALGRAPLGSQPSDARSRSRSQSAVGPLPHAPVETPTTLGMSASQVPVQFSVEKPTPWGRITAGVILLAALTGIILVLVTDNGPAPAPESATQPATQPAAGQPVTATEPAAAQPSQPSVAPLAELDASVPAVSVEADAGVPDAAPVAPTVAKSGKSKGKSGKGKSGKGKSGKGKSGKGKSGKGDKGKGDGDSDDDLFGTRK